MTNSETGRPSRAHKWKFGYNKAAKDWAKKGVNAEGEPSQRDRQRERETWKKGNTRISVRGIPQREEGEPGASNKIGKMNEHKQNDYKNVRNGPEVVLSSVGSIIRVERKQRYNLRS